MVVHMFYLIGYSFKLKAQNGMLLCQISATLAQYVFVIYSIEVKIISDLKGCN